MTEKELIEIGMTREEWDEITTRRILYNTMKADLKKYKINTNKER